VPGKPVPDQPGDIHGNDKDRDGDGNSGEFNDAMKEGVVQGADEAKGNEDNYDEGNVSRIGRACGCFSIQLSSAMDTIEPQYPPLPDML